MYYVLTLYVMRILLRGVITWLPYACISLPPSILPSELALSNAAILEYSYHGQVLLSICIYVKAHILVYSFTYLRNRISVIHGPSTIK